MEEDEPSLGERMTSARVSPEMIHYQAHHDAKDRLYHIVRERERLERRCHRLPKDFEARRATLSAIAKRQITPS